MKQEKIYPKKNRELGSTKSQAYAPTPTTLNSTTHKNQRNKWMKKLDS